MDETQGNDVTATYSDMASARKAIQSLERHGVDGHDITLLGDADTAALRRDNIERDERLITYVARSAAMGAVFGAMVGGLLGTITGVLIFPWLSGAMWGTAGGGAILGAALGVLLGGIVRLPQSNAGLATIDTPHKGPVTLGIHNPDSIDDTLAATNPTDVEHVSDVRAELAKARKEAAAHDTEAKKVEGPAAGGGWRVGGRAPRTVPPPEHQADTRNRVLVIALAAAVVAAIVVWVRRR